MSLLKQNEKEANQLVAKVMRITFVIITASDGKCFKTGTRLY